MTRKHEPSALHFTVVLFFKKLGQVSGSPTGVPADLFLHSFINLQASESPPSGYQLSWETDHALKGSFCVCICIIRRNHDEQG